MVTRLLALLFLLAFAGCGYRMGNMLPPGIRTVAVPIFDNDTLYRGYEFPLTEAVVAEILNLTSLQIAAPKDADTRLEATIKRISQTTVTKDENRLATRLDITITVQMSWHDLRTGRIIMPPRKVAETVEINTSQGETLDNAIAQGLRKLARRIVYTLEDSHLVPL